MSKGPTGHNEQESRELLREYVYRALIGKAKGSDVSTYNNFVKEFASLRKKVERDPTEHTVHMLANLIQAVKDCVSALKERKHEALVTEVLGIRLWSIAPVIREAVLDLVSNLVVANSAYTHSCLQLLIYSFLPPPSPPSQEADETGPWKPSPEALAIQASVLSALDKVLMLVPTAPTNLLPLVTQHMPHKLRDRSTQCMYLTAIFRIAEAPSGAPIRDGLLAAVVEHLLTIDVEIKWEDIVDVPTGEEKEEEEVEQEEDVEDMFEIEGMSELDINATPEELQQRQQQLLQQQQQQQQARGGWEGAVPSQQPTATTSGRPPVEEAANKLDSMMELTFEHLATRCQADDVAQTWDALLAIFERSILNTHRSKFSQFLVFFMCYKHPSLARSFVDLLLARLLDSRQHAITRSACAAYLASFLARSVATSHALVVNVLERLVGFCQAYASSAVELPRRSSSGLGMVQVIGATASAEAVAAASISAGAGASLTTRHQVFYASVQAVLYVLCYHLEPLMASYPTNPAPAAPAAMAASVARPRSTNASKVAALVRSHIAPLLSHWLAPLNVCLPSVVNEFRQQVVALRLLDAAMLPVVDEGARQAQRPLEMFFPFDPYLLKRSSRHLELKSSYICWRHGRPQAGAGAAALGSQQADGDDSGSSSEEEEEEDAQAGPDTLHPAGTSDEDLDSEDELDNEVLPPLAVLGRPTAGLARKPQAASRMAHPWNGFHTGKRGLSGEDPNMMATSFSPGDMSSMGDMTPTGTSPVLVNYMSPNHLGGSPMQIGGMTPPNMSWMLRHHA